jgi:hypothetical protein
MFSIGKIFEMSLKTLILVLVLTFIIVLGISYYTNKEGFDDISNGYLSGLSKDLESAMNTVSTDVSSTIATIDSTSTTQDKNDSTPASNGSVPVRNEVVPEVNISGSGYDAMTLQQKSELLRDIQKVVRNEILANRDTTPIIPGNCKAVTTSVVQGQEYDDSCHKDTEFRCPKNPDGTCPPMPDMSQYIKKDAIPCYGCTLDY